MKQKSGNNGKAASTGSEYEKMALRGLLRHRVSGIFYGRIRYKGKLIRRSLETTDYNIARDRLPSYVVRWKEEADTAQAKEERKQPMSWQEATDILFNESKGKAAREEVTYSVPDVHERLLNKILFFWPGLSQKAVRDIPEPGAKDFFTNAASGKGEFTKRKVPRGQGRKKGDYEGGKCSPSQYNRMLWSCNRIVALAQKHDLGQSYPEFENPFGNIAQRGETHSIPIMPTNEEFDAILEEILRKRHGTGPEHRQRGWDCTKLLAMTGSRIGEVIGGTDRRNPNDPPHPGITWRDLHDDVPEPYTNVRCEKKLRNEDNWQRSRRVPFIHGMKEFVAELRARWYRGNDDELIFQPPIKGVKNSGISRQAGVNGFLRRACKALKLPHLHQQDLRHLFATSCIEAGATFKELAEWLGHEDGGILCAKIYAHVRPRNAFLTAQKVCIGKKKANLQPTDVEKKDSRIAELEAKIRILEGSPAEAA